MWVTSPWLRVPSHHSQTCWIGIGNPWRDVFNYWMYTFIIPITFMSPSCPLTQYVLFHALLLCLFLTYGYFKDYCRQLYIVLFPGLLASRYILLCQCPFLSVDSLFDFSGFWRFRCRTLCCARPGKSHERVCPSEQSRLETRE